MILMERSTACRQYGKFYEFEDGAAKLWEATTPIALRAPPRLQPASSLRAINNSGFSFSLKYHKTELESLCKGFCCALSRSSPSLAAQVTPRRETPQTFVFIP